MTPDEEVVVQHLRHYGMARDRRTDRQLRTVTITDDDALVLLALIASVEEAEE